MLKYFRRVAQEMEREDLVALPTSHEAKVSLLGPLALLSGNGGFRGLGWGPNSPLKCPSLTSPLC